MENSFQNPRILVVDDEVDIREGSARILSRMGSETLTASRGEEALAIMETEPVSILLLDLKMPGMDGMEVLHQVRQKYPEVLVIIITGFATVETAIEAMKKGAYDFIPKPFEPEHLRLVVKRAAETLRLTWERESLEKARTRTLMDLGTEKSRIRTIIESLPNGLVVTNSQAQVVLMNPAFFELLGVDSELSLGHPIDRYVSDAKFCALVRAISSGRYQPNDPIPTHELSAPGGNYLLARGRPVMGEENECLGAVITLVNITAMKVLDQMKSEFVAKVSHELRSPLSTIHEQLALVLSDMVDQEDTVKDQNLLSRAKEKTQGLIALIGDLLDLSRIEAGGGLQEPKSVQLDALLTDITDFLRTKAQSKNQQLELDIPQEGLPPVFADPVALESIFGNLITNAINYTPEGGRVRVSGRTDDQAIQVEVADNGFGIEPRHQEKIFDRFFRVKNEKTRYITGTGLGLPIVKNLVENLEGTISVESAPDAGSTFTVRLPREKLETRND